ncbi:SurA N-terminal domain-containing protein [Bacteroides eggerthii]|uniref:SurA N-terminal domain-containing protein n=1 Tax=Bacteroides eggerthii TaxID=28111 RepID=A0ABT7U431_9BACE|nr:SurA N-terminal domain-containing protein [Bacteroides eggerthii]
MATLQKIRSKGPLLMIVVGLALFAFIAEEFFRSMQSASAESKQRVGEIYGESLSYQDFQAMVDEYTEVVKLTRGANSLDSEEMTQIRDQVWNTYVQNKLIEHEAEKLGLTVTDAEVQEIINKGQSQYLMQTPFRNEQTGAFDVNMLKKFLADYDNMKKNPSQMPADYIQYYESLFKMWQFIEKSIKQEALVNKYQSLLAHTVISNPVSAKMNFEGRVNESDVLLASVPFTTIADSTIKVEDADLKAKYEEMKENFKQISESRDFKYISVRVRASEKDKADLKKEMDEVSKQLVEGGNIAKIVREGGSLVNYSEIPVGKAALPGDIAMQLDTMTLNKVVGPYYNPGDQTYNVVKLMDRVSAPDSIQYRQIQIAGADEATNTKTADSIMTALNNGTPFDSIAKKYGQTGEKIWITSRNYEGATMGADDLKYIKAIRNGNVNELQNLKISQANIILQVTDRRAMDTKYDVAIVKCPVIFSNETYSKAYNDFSQFLAANPTLEAMEANAAKAGYQLLTQKDMFSNQHTVAGISNTSEALRWLFNEDTEVNSVSKMYECGNNDNMLVVALTAVNPVGYRSMESVKDILTREVIKDKKAKQISEKMASWKSVNDARQMTGAVVDTVKHITFNSPVFVSATGSNEPAINGAVDKTNKGQFKSGVKGMAGVYAFQVLNKTKGQEKMDAKAEENMLNSKNMRGMGQFIMDLYNKAEVMDHRYLFF